MWDPKDTLRLSSEYCAGFNNEAVHQHCHGRLAPVQIRVRAALFKMLKELYPRADELKPVLQILAREDLCDDHQHQKDVLVLVWLGRIEAACPSTPNRARVNPTNFAGLVVFALLLDRMNQSIEENSRKIRGLIPVLMWRQEPLPDLRVAILEVLGFHAHSTKAAVKAHRIFHTQLILTSIRPGALRDALRFVHAASVISRDTIEAIDEARRVANAKGATMRRARRVPYEKEDCPVCYVPLTDHGDGGGLVWCKACCGRSVHNGCFEAWVDSCQKDDDLPTQPTCAVCRAMWINDLNDEPFGTEAPSSSVAGW